MYKCFKKSTLRKKSDQGLFESAMQMWVFRLLAGVADAFGDNKPDDDPATDHKGQKQENQA